MEERIKEALKKYENEILEVYKEALIEERAKALESKCSRIEKFCRIVRRFEELDHLTLLMDHDDYLIEQTTNLFDEDLKEAREEVKDITLKVLAEGSLEKASIAFRKIEETLEREECPSYYRNSIFEVEVDFKTKDFKEKVRRI